MTISADARGIVRTAARPPLPWGKGRAVSGQVSSLTLSFSRSGEGPRALAGRRQIGNCTKRRTLIEEEGPAGQNRPVILSRLSGAYSSGFKPPFPGGCAR